MKGGVEDCKIDAWKQYVAVDFVVIVGVEFGLSELDVAEEEVTGQADQDDHEPAETDTEFSVFVPILPVDHVRYWWFFQVVLVILAIGVR